MNKELDRAMKKKWGEDNIEIYEGDIDNLQSIMIHYAEQMGYGNTFEWSGPNFKPEDKYMTIEGYPLGTEIWYVRLILHGAWVNIFGTTPLFAVQNAHEALKRKLSIGEIKKEYQNA